MLTNVDITLIFNFTEQLNWVNLRPISVLLSLVYIYIDLLSYNVELRLDSDYLDKFN